MYHVFIKDKDTKEILKRMQFQNYRDAQSFGRSSSSQTWQYFEIWHEVIA